MRRADSLPVPGGCCACVAAPAGPAAGADLPLEVSPPDVNLATSRSRQVFVVQATFADGITRDVTAEAKATLANPALAKLDKNVLTPLADGATS